MIVSVFLLLSYIFEIFKKSLSNDKPKQFDYEAALLLLEGLDVDTVGIHDEQIGVRFIPPAFIQRYNIVCQILDQLHNVYSLKKVVDIGCAELALFSRIKRYNFIEEFIGVDVDADVLDKSTCRIKPLNTDYLNKRCTPLSVVMLNGSASDPDERLKGANAVIAIELIEHMYPPELDELPYTVFGIIQPEVAIFTTPNADFNRFFKSLNPNEFRHYDHKFEWSRSQFQDWGNNLASRYPSYEVWYHGIAFGPVDTFAYGSCSQMAVFLRRLEKTDKTSEFGVYYKHIYEQQYPYQTPEEKFNDTLEYEVCQFIERCRQEDDFLDGETFKIPLEDILSNIKVFCTQEQLKAFLERSGKTVQNINNRFTLLVPLYPDDNSSESSFDENINWVYIDKQKNLNREDDEEIWEENWEDISPPQSSSSFRIPDWKSGSEDALDQSKLPSNGLLNVLKSEEQSINVLVDESKVRESKTIIKGSIQLCTWESGAIPKTSLGDMRSKTATRLMKEQQDCDTRVVGMDLEICHEGSNPPSLTENRESGYSNSLQEMELDRTVEKVDEIVTETEMFKNDSFSDHLGSFPRTTEAHERHEEYLPSNYRSDKDKTRSQETIDHLSEVRTLNGENKAIENVIKSGGVIEDLKVNGFDFETTSSGAAPRSHSLENINIRNAKKKNFRRSLNMDSKQDSDTRSVDMDLEICIKGSSPPSLTETCGSLSKAADSGYPNSVQEMELDRTPEQVDEIVTETESSLEDEESSGDERVVEEHIHGIPPIVFVDNVENGDVANNNRDGEGNNMEGGQVLAEEVVFEDLLMGVEEAEGEVESEDEGLFMSALDISNNTVVAEEQPPYLCDLQSVSSYDSFRTEENSVDSLLPIHEFPPWLINIISPDEGSGDAGAEGGSTDREGLDDFYPIDRHAAGESTLLQD